jgi:hypothetical protein
MTIQKYKASREDVIRIEVIEFPMEREPGEGLYEWIFREDKFLLDMLTLEKEIDKYVPKKRELVLDRLQNFRKVFINLTTGAIDS